MVPLTQPHRSVTSRMLLAWQGPASLACLSCLARAGYSPGLLSSAQSIFSEVLGELSVIKTGLNFKEFCSGLKEDLNLALKPLRGDPPPPLVVGSWCNCHLWFLFSRVNKTSKPWSSPRAELQKLAGMKHFKFQTDTAIKCGNWMQIIYYI